MVTPQVEHAGATKDGPSALAVDREHMNVVQECFIVKRLHAALCNDNKQRFRTCFGPPTCSRDNGD